MADRVVHDCAGVDSLEDPADRAMALSYGGRCATMLAPTATATAIAARLIAEVEQSVLKDFEAAAFGLHGQVAAHNGDRDAATASLRAAIRLATAQGLRPLEVGLRLELAPLEDDDDGRAEHLTRGMELARELALEMPAALAAPYLGSAENQTLRQRLRDEHQRCLVIATAP